MVEFKNNRDKVLKRYIIKKCVVSGNRVEFYNYSVPVRCQFVREKNVLKNYLSDNVKREDNLSRARQNVRRIIWSNLSLYTKFLTLTTAEACLDLSEFSHKMKMFFQSMKRQGFELKYIYVIERQLERGKKEGNAGSLHAHIVVFNEEKIPLKVLKKAWTHGRTELKILNGLRWDKDYRGYRKGDRVTDVGAYVCKYITKESSLEFGSRTYRCSNGLIRPFSVDVIGDGDLKEGIFPYVFDDSGKQAYDIYKDIVKIHYMDAKIVPMRYTERESYQIIDYAQGEF